MDKLRVKCSIFFLLINLFSLQSITSSSQWYRGFFSSCNPVDGSVLQTPDNSYIMFSKVDCASSWLLKVDCNGDPLWFNVYDMEKSFQAEDMQLTSDGGYILAGNIDSGDMEIIKLDSFGNVQWAKIYSSNLYDVAYSIKQTQEGGYIFVGKSQSPPPVKYYTFILKFDNFGNIQWQKSFDLNNNFPNFIQRTSDNGFILLDSYYSSSTNSYDVLLLKLESSGNIQWEKTYGGTGRLEGTFIIETFDSAFILAGNSYCYDTGDYNVWIAKLNQSGDIQWQKMYGEMGNETVNSIQQNPDGSFILGGAKLNMPWFFKIDGSGNVIWEKIHNDYTYMPEETLFITSTSDGCFIAAEKMFYFGETYFMGILKTEETGNISGCDFPTNTSSFVTDASLTPSEPTIEVITLNFQEEASSPSVFTPYLGRIKFCLDSTYYNLAIVKNGSGKVVSDPVGINCGFLCNDQFKENTTVILNASSSPGSYFESWGMDCVDTGNTQTQVQMNSSKICTANFLSCDSNLGDPSENGIISALDASLVLQNIVGIKDFTRAQYCKADVNGSSTVTSLDASYILQCSVGLCSNLPPFFLPSCQSHGNCP
ncbi:MAG: dockerin type I repeat-containing protein [Thermoanaerobaculia bacterium]